MKHFPATIATANLQLSDVPDEPAELSAINYFALTLDASENIPYDPKQEDWRSFSIQSSLAQLRSRLYLEQRRWNHYGRLPDAGTEAEIRRIVSLIRAKLAGQVKDAKEPEK